MSNPRPPTADNPKLRAKQELLSQLLNESVDLCLPGRVTCKNAFAVSLLERIARVLASDETLRMSSDLQAGAYILEAANKLFSQRVDGVSSLVLRVLDELSKAKATGGSMEQLGNESADASSENENHLASEPAFSNSEHFLDTANASIVSHADLEQHHASKFEFLRGYLDNQSFDKHLLLNVKTNTECALLLQGGDLAVPAKDSDSVSALTATTAATSTSCYAKKRNEYHVRYDMPVSELLKLMESRKSGGGGTSASASATSSCDRDVGVTEGKEFLSVEKALRAAGANASTNTNKRPSMEDSEDSSEDSNSACSANAAAGELPARFIHKIDQSAQTATTTRARRFIHNHMQLLFALQNRKRQPERSRCGLDHKNLTENVKRTISVSLDPLLYNRFFAGYLTSLPLPSWWQPRRLSSSAPRRSPHLLNSACSANAAAGELPVAEELHSVLKRLSKQGARFKSMYFENQQAAVSGSEGTATGGGGAGGGAQHQASELYTYFGSASPKSAPPRPVKRFSSTENQNRQENFPKSSFRQAFEENEQLTEHRTRRVLEFSEEEMEQYEKQWTVGEKTAGEGAAAAPGDRLDGDVFAVWGGDASPRFTKEEVLAREMGVELEDGYQYQVESDFADLELGTGGLLDAKILDLDVGSSHAAKPAAGRTENTKSVSTGVPLSSTGVPPTSDSRGSSSERAGWEKKEQGQKLRSGEASFSPVGAMGALDFEDEFLFPEMRGKNEKVEDGVFYEHVEAPVRELPQWPLKMKAKKKTVKTAASGGPAAKKQRKGVVVRMLDDDDESSPSSSIRIKHDGDQHSSTPQKPNEILAIAPDLLGRAYSELLDVLLEPAVSPPSSPCWHKEKMAVGSDCGGVAGARSDLGDAEEAEGMLAEMTAVGEGDIDVVPSGVVSGRAEKVAEEPLPFAGVEPMEVDGTNSGKTVFQSSEQLSPNRADQLGVEFDLSRSAGGPMEEAAVPMEEVAVPMEEVAVPMEEVAVPMEEVRDLLAKVMDELFEEFVASRGEEGSPRNSPTIEFKQLVHHFMLAKVMDELFEEFVASRAMESREEESELQLPTIEFKQVLARTRAELSARSSPDNLRVTTAMCFLGLLTVANMSGALTLNQESAENFQIVKDVPGKLAQMLANHGLACEN